ncbi:MAG TPA: ABC transporter permease [Kofleriaceae bacterium]|nr:ABC transporter permease [Kofleriaceae bacterium]
MRREATLIATALLVAMAAGSILILIYGQSPARVYVALFSRTWGSTYGIGQVLFKSTPLIFTGLAVAIAFRCGLFNIGAEGQLAAGAFATGLVAASVHAPAVIAVPVAMIAGACAGGVIGAIPGALRAFTGAHEVINTIMLNFIVAALILWAGGEGAFASGTTHTALIDLRAAIPDLGIEGSAANVSILIALAAAVAVWFVLGRTRRGFELCAVGENPAAAENAGISVRAMTIWAMTLSGAIAGLVGTSTVLGYKHYFEEGMGRGTGFMGIAVALLGRNHPLGVVAAALVFGTLSHGGIAVSGICPKEIVDVLEAVIILALAVGAAAGHLDKKRKRA